MKKFASLPSFLGLAVATLALSACALTGGGGGGGKEPTVDLNRTLTAAEIHTILAGKSWRFVGPNNTGTTIYAADGTSLVEVDGKGTTKGHWETRDGQLCESFEPSAFLPGGVPLGCYPFAASGANTYQVGKATFTPAS
jgi:hypothetical protein